MWRASRLRELRLSRGESLQDVASALGVSKTHIWELEKGRSRNPSAEMLEGLADHFDVTVRFLIGEDHETDTGDEQLSRMFRQAGRLDDNERAILDDMIQSMIRRRRDASD